ncbi:MAG: hypothetical protein COB08_002855 [Rhodobacteraceae bacterium]|nr:hypothetical protein [Paracoccaceae bacterium]
MTKTPICTFVSSFLIDEDGAVTVDWVMLTAGIVLLGVMVLSGIRVSLGAAATSIANTISIGLT